MFKLYSVDKNNNEKEILPENGIYIVYELFEYKFYYTGNIVESTIFIEDEAFDYSLIICNSNFIKLKEKNRIFEDYFGYLSLNINKEKINFEVRIQKLKVPELEEMLLYLWNQDPIIFDNFLSKSTIKAKLDKEKHTLNYSSKFVNIFEDFFIFFESKFLTFKSLSHYVLRTKGTITNYDLADISNSSIEWLVHNLDELHIDIAYKNIENSIQINNNYGLVEKIFTENKINDFNVYENQIILGSFEFIILEINKIKNKIKNNISMKNHYEREFYSINEFKTIPFLKLRDDLDRMESKIRILQRKYNDIFLESKPKNSFPRLTPVFSNKRHYTEAYNKIKLLRNIKINLDDELNLLNIKKISTLYERFNLFILVNSFLSKHPNNYTKENPKESDNIFQEFYFYFTNCKISLYYDYKIDSNPNATGLQRISKGYFRPDYVIKIESKDGTKFYILDSKYSSETTVRNNHLIKCTKDYILDIGITGNSSSKVEGLYLIYPGEREDIIYGNTFFKPIISIIPSKVKKDNIREFIDTIFNYNIGE